MPIPLCGTGRSDVEVGAAAKYAKAPGLRDVIQTVFGWTDSPCSANWAATDAVEPPCAGNRGAWWQSNAMNKFSRARQRCWPRAPAESEQSGNITLPHSRLNSSGTRRGQQAAALCSTRPRPSPCFRFRSLRPENFDRILASEPGMTCYSRRTKRLRSAWTSPACLPGTKSSGSVTRRYGGPGGAVNHTFRLL